MKFTNVKQLIIKFMGGGLINFPTRFLRWIKIDGDTEGDGGGGSDSDVFFVPATIQPKYFSNSNGTEPIDIKNYTPDTYNLFLYNKEDIISLGVNEEDLNNLDYIGVTEAIDDFYDNNGANGYQIQQSVFSEKIILYDFSKLTSKVTIYNNSKDAYLYKISDDIFAILQLYKKENVG